MDECIGKAFCHEVHVDRGGELQVFSTTNVTNHEPSLIEYFCNTHPFQSYTERGRVRRLVGLTSLFDINRRLEGIRRRSNGQGVLHNHVELHDEAAGINVVGMDTKTRNRPRSVHDVGDGIGTMLLARLFTRHEQILIPGVGRKVSGIGAAQSERGRWFRPFGSRKLG